MGYRERCVAVGALAGLFSGFTGVGGGALLVGLMVSVQGMEQRMAHGTSLTVILPTALFAAISYLLQGLSGRFAFDAPLALSVAPALAAPSLAGVIIGATWMSALPAAALRRAFGVFLAFVAFTMLTRGLLSIGAPTDMAVEVPFIFWILLGFVMGVFSGFLGIGGAMVIIPFMTLGAGMPQHMAQGISLAVVALTTMVGTFTHRRLGNIDGSVVLPMAPVSVVAAVVASLVAGQVDGFWLTKVCGVVMAYFAYQFTFGGAPVRRDTGAKSEPRNPTAGFYNI